MLKGNKNLTFKNNAPFRSYISITYNIFIGNAEDLDLVMLLYNLLEYSDNLYMTSGIFNANRINNNKKMTSKSFKYKTKIIESTPNNNNTLDAEVIAPLRCLSNFWRFLNFPLINCKIELDLTW